MVLFRFTAPWALSVALAGLASSLTTACSSSGEGSTFQQPGQPTGSSSGTPIPDFAGPDPKDQLTCEPANQSGFTPQIKSPKAAQKVCSKTDLEDFYSKCLTPPVDKSVCDAFHTAHAACTGCLESKESDAQLGAVIWRSNGAYYTVNVAGCITNAEKSTSPDSCGIAYESAVQCYRAACTQCFGGDASQFEAFSRCQQAASDKACQPFASKEGVACDGVASGGQPGSDCMPPNNASPKDAFLLVAPKFCGP